MDRGPFLLAKQLALRVQEYSRLRNTTPRARPRGTWEGISSMQHITCDLCGKGLRPGEDHRYVVKIEAYAAHDPAELTEADLDEDHMEALSKTRRELEGGAPGPKLVEPYQSFRYDLCSECHRKF